jgi:hypothetical protein
MSPFALEAALDDPTVQRWLLRALLFSEIEEPDVRN